MEAAEFTELTAEGVGLERILEDGVSARGCHAQDQLWRPVASLIKVSPREERQPGL